LEEIVWWVLGWSGRVEVVKPDESREMVVEHLRKGMDLNSAGEAKARSSAGV
jgi:predicted DNA-binding transcriptional regulator YafY